MAKRFDRVVLKVSGESLSKPGELGIDPEELGLLAEEIADALAKKLGPIAPTASDDPEARLSGFANPKMADFARHYGTVVLPTQPARPEHKGKIEAGVKYAESKSADVKKIAAQLIYVEEHSKVNATADVVAKQAKTSGVNSSAGGAK